LCIWSIERSFDQNFITVFSVIYLSAACIIKPLFMLWLIAELSKLPFIFQFTEKKKKEKKSY